MNPRNAAQRSSPRLGPASNTEPVFRNLVRAGVDVVRLNFSHGTHEEKLALIQMIRKVSREERKPLCILGDLQGPKIRTSKLKDHQAVLLKAGQRLTITPREVPGTASLVGTTFKTLAENVEQGSRILLSDGLIELRVHEVVGDDVVCEIINGGMLGENKGINLPGIPVRVPSLTEKDTEDLEFALKNGVDAIAVSFVRTAEDVRLVRNRVAALGGETWIIAKLEKPQAIEHLDGILQAADGIMVARGDLGVELPPEKVPAIQKHIIRRAAEYRKPVITATQMLESMIDNPRPTRAEVSDVANAVYDGTDAVMLSGESAIGKYPVETVAMMARIVADAERHIKEDSTCSHGERRSAPLDRRDDLRSHGPRRRRSGSARHRPLYRVGRDRTPALEVSPFRADLRAQPGRGHHQPPQPAVGHYAHPLPQGQLDRGAGGLRRKPAGTERLRAAPRSDRHRGRNAHQVRLDQLPAPARDGRAQHGRRPLLRSARGGSDSGCSCRCRGGSTRGQDKASRSQAGKDSEEEVSRAKTKAAKTPLRMEWRFCCF